LLAIAFSQSFRTAAQAAGIPPEQLTGHPLLWGLGIALALFASVVVHELAHSLYALSKGGKVRGITLLMIGGVSQLAEPPKEARHEGVMALMGPATSLALGMGLVGAQGLFGATPNLRLMLLYVGLLNLVLGFFNLLPAFPMDGGRILRAALTRRMGRVGATRLAGRLGKGFALLFALWGLASFNLVLMLIAFFVFAGAEAETQTVILQEVLGSLRVVDLNPAPVLVAAAEASLEEAASELVRHNALVLAVVASDGKVGVLTPETVQTIPAARRREATAAEAALPVPVVTQDAPASEVLRLLGGARLPLVLVVDAGGKPIGRVGREELGRTLKLRELQDTAHPGNVRFGRRQPA